LGASALNRAAIERTVKTWDQGMSWRELNRAYHAAALDLGGFVRDPGAMVWGHPRGAESALTLQTGLEDFQVERGQHVMFDCHGTLDLYCWDGGKTWVAGGEPRAEGRKNLRATAQVAGGVPAMCDGVTQGQPGMDLSLFSRDVIAMATAIPFSKALRVRIWRGRRPCRMASTSTVPDRAALSAFSASSAAMVEE